MVHGLLILSPYEKWPVLFLGGAIPNVLSAYAARANATSLSFAVMFCGTLPVNSLGVPITRKSILVRPHQRHTKGIEPRVLAYDPVSTILCRSNSDVSMVEAAGVAPASFRFYCRLSATMYQI